MKTRGKQHLLTMEATETDLLLHFDGKLIAKRGAPGTRHARTCIPLEPGFSVRDSSDGSEIIVEFDGVCVQ